MATTQLTKRTWSHSVVFYSNPYSIHCHHGELGEPVYNVWKENFFHYGCFLSTHIGTFDMLISAQNEVERLDAI